MTLKISMTALLAVIIVGCSHHEQEHLRLESLWWMADSVPLVVLDSLDKMDISLREKDVPKDVLMHERLLRIRALDKAYITHTSDSTIIPLLEYYSKRKSDVLWLWTLYYAGRMNADLGDSPRAIEYYFKALEELPEKPDSSLLVLKGVLANQSARILDQQKLYDEAIKYNMLSLSVAKELNDSTGEVIDLYDLALLYSDVNNTDSAMYYYDKTLEKAKRPISDNFTIDVTASMASYFSKIGNLEKADSLIGRILPYLKNFSGRPILAVIATVYEDKERTDSAKILWKKVCEEGSLSQQIGATGWLAYHALKENDTKNAYLYTVKYNQLYDSLRKTDRMEEVARIKSLYDYSLRERDNASLEKANHRKDVIILASGVSLLLIVALGIFFYFKERLRREKTRTLVQEIINEGLRKDAIYKSEVGRLTNLTDELEKEVIRLKSVVKVCEEGKEKNEDLEIVRLFKDAGQGSNPKIGKEEWKRLETYIGRENPLFSKRLALLNLNREEKRVSLLIKIGIDQQAAANILGLTPAAVGMRRLRLAQKYLPDSAVKGRDWDDFIKSL